MKNSQLKIFIGVIGILILGTMIAVVLNSGSGASTTPGKYDDFAKCIKNSGAVFYGAFWCPHCQAQKEEFGSSEQYLPYVECSTPDAQGETQICTDKKITTYPTWVFPDGSTLSGTIPMTTLAQKTSCSIPDGQTGSPSSSLPTGSTRAVQSSSASSSSTQSVPVK